MKLKSLWNNLVKKSKKLFSLCLPTLLLTVQCAAGFSSTAAIGNQALAAAKKPTKQGASAMKISAAPAKNPLKETGEKKTVPILLYHNLARDTETSISASTIYESQFRAELDTLKAQGCTAVTFQQMINFVERGIPLPERPVCITFDDGYLSNYEIAFPILQEYGMKATIFVVGSSVGCTEYYKDTQHRITPHFSYEQAAEMANSGMISIQSHTYDMHQWAPFETGNKVRRNILQLPGESTEAYTKFLKADFTRSRSEIEDATGREVNILSYPGGAVSKLSQQILRDMGVKATMTIQSKKAVLVRGRPTSLERMGRFYVKSTTKPEEFLKWITP